MRKVLLLFAISFAPINLFGCSVTSRPDYGSLGLVQIAGSVSVDGAPIPNVEIRFQTQEDGTYSYGKTDSLGRYSLMFDSDTPGIIPGRKQVIIIAGRSSDEESSDRDSDQDVNNSAVQGSVVVVPICYGRESKVNVEVTQSDSSFDIDFKSDCSTVGR